MYNDEWEMLTALYESMPAQRKREFWQLKGSQGLKQSFLMRWGWAARIRGAA